MQSLTPSNMNFTKKQINHFRAYELIRSSGHYNMLSPQARLATCLDKDDYLFVLKHYSELKEASEQAHAEEALLKAVDHS